MLIDFGQCLNERRVNNCGKEGISADDPDSTRSNLVETVGFATCLTEDLRQAKHISTFHKLHTTLHVIRTCQKSNMTFKQDKCTMKTDRCIKL